MSDGAFRTLFYLCVIADDEAGAATVSYKSISIELDRKTRATLPFLTELNKLGIIESENQHSTISGALICAYHNLLLGHFQ